MTRSPSACNAASAESKTDRRSASGTSCTVHMRCLSLDEEPLATTALVRGGASERASRKTRPVQIRTLRRRVPYAVASWLLALRARERLPPLPRRRPGLALVPIDIRRLSIAADERAVR